MARTLRDEILRWTLVVNGDSAKKELNDLSRANAEVAAKIKELEKESRRMEKAGETKKKRYKEITAELKQLNATYSENDKRIKELQQELGIAGKTMAQLRKEARDLRHQLANTVPGTKDYRELELRLAAVTHRMNEVQGKSGSLRASFNSLADGANKYFNIITGGIAVIAGFVLSLKELINKNAELADQQANVMKTTGMSLEEVRDLQSEFKSFNTRSTQMDLLALAEEAGRLGKTGKADILSFVRTADMLKVALGDDLGGEEAIRDVGKLAEQFKIAEEYAVSYGVAMEKLGSGINEISAKGANQAGYLVDFMKRISGIDGQVKIGAPNILGYAAALDEAGQSAEVAGTVFNNILPNMFKDPATYAKIAGVGVKEFTELLKTDSNEALILFLNGLKGSGEGFDVMAKKMDELKLDGARSISVLASLANNTEKVRERQTQANKAMQEGISLSNEFAIKNNNLAATTEKVTKWLFQKIVVSSGAQSALERLFNSLSKITDIPLSATLEDQRLKLATLQIQLSDGNLAFEKRTELIRKLKEEYPEYLGHLNEETVSNQVLFREIEKVNRLYKEKIQMQILQEQAEKSANRALEWQRLAAESEQKLLKLVAQRQGNLRKANNESLEEFVSRLKRAQNIGENSWEVIDNAMVTYKYHVDQVNKAIEDHNNLLNNQEAFRNWNARFSGDENGIFGGKSLKKQQEELKFLFGKPAEVQTKLTVATETYEERAERIKKEREQRDKGHQTLLKDIENFLKSESALHAQARAENLMSEEQYKEGLRMMQVTGFRMRSDALKAYLARLGADEVDKRQDVNGQLADIRREAAEWEISDMQDFHAWAEAELKKHFDNVNEINEREYEKLKNANAARRRDSLISAELNVLKFAPGSKDELQARKDLLDAQMALELESTFLTENEVLKIKMQFANQKKMLDKEYWENYVQVALQSVSALMSSYTAFANARDQKELDEYRQMNDEKKDNLRRSLDSKMISEETYRTQLAALEDEYRQKEREIKTEQFKRQRIADSIQATINTAVAVTRLLANPVLAVAAGIAGAAQVGLILAQPVPAFAEGKYPVTTTEGKKFNASYSGPVRTGMFSKPTLGLFGEEGKELVISAPHVKHLEMNYPEIIEAILHTRMPAYSRGRYEGAAEKYVVPERRIDRIKHRIDDLTSTSSAIAEQNRGQDIIIERLDEILAIMQENSNNPRPAELSWRHYNEFKEKATTIESKYGV